MFCGLVNRMYWNVPSDEPWGLSCFVPKSAVVAVAAPPALTWIVVLLFLTAAKMAKDLTENYAVLTSFSFFFCSVETKYSFRFP